MMFRVEGSNIHHHDYLLIRPAGQLDGPHRSLVNSSDAYVSTTPQAAHILEIGPKPEGPAEKKMFVANQEDSGSQNE